MKNQFEPNNIAASSEQQDSYLATQQVGAMPPDKDSEVPQRRYGQSNQNQQQSSKHTIFQQYIAPATNQGQPPPNVAQQQKSSPKAMHYQNSMMMHKNLSSIGKNLVMQHKNQYNQQASHAPNDYGKQIDNPQNCASQNESHSIGATGTRKNQTGSYEESREQFYGAKQIPGPGTTSGGNASEGQDIHTQELSQKNNNLNQGLLQIQPQTSKRGQRRHFPTKNGIEILMRNIPSSNSKPPQENPGDSNRSQASNTQGRFMRAPFISGMNYQLGGAATQSTSGGASQNNAPGTSAIVGEQSEQSGNSSIFQKNRLNLQIQKQANSYKQPNSSETKDGEQNKNSFGQFKFPQSALPQHGTHVLGQYGASVMRQSPKNQGRSRLGQFKNPQSDDQNQTFSPQPKTPAKDKAQLLIRKTQAKHKELLRDRDWINEKQIFMGGANCQGCSQKQSERELSLCNGNLKMVVDYEGYTGQVKDKEGRKVKHGIGHLKLDHYSYQGSFVDDFKSGLGTESWTDGSGFIGSFLEGVKSGIGQQTWLDGSKLIGEFQIGQDGEIVVNGLYKLPNGSLLQGLFTKGILSGQGIQVNKDQSIYKGEFKNNKKSGQGILLSKNQAYNGEWFEGKQEGKCFFIHQKKNTFDVQKFHWKEGKKISSSLQLGEDDFETNIKQFKELDGLKEKVYEQLQDYEARLQILINQGQNTNVSTNC